jgi:hypothetical protein
VNIVQCRLSGYSSVREHLQRRKCLANYRDERRIGLGLQAQMGDESGLHILFLLRGCQSQQSVGTCIPKLTCSSLMVTATMYRLISLCVSCAQCFMARPVSLRVAIPHWKYTLHTGGLYTLDTQYSSLVLECIVSCSRDSSGKLFSIFQGTTLEGLRTRHQ